MLYGMIFFPMLMALAAWLAGKHSQKTRNILASLTTAAEFCLAVCLAFLPNLSSSLKGFAGLGISLETDGFRRVYLLVITFLWMMTMLFGNEYFSHYQNCGRYYFYNLMTLGAAVGVFLSADLYTALLFFEIMSFTSYTWVIQEETEKAVRAANTYLAVAVIGGLAALMGLFLLWHELGTTRISELYAAAQQCHHKGVLYAAGGCVLFGFGAIALLTSNLLLSEFEPYLPVVDECGDFILKKDGTPLMPGEELDEEEEDLYAEMMGDMGMTEEEVLEEMRKLGM